MRAGTPAQISRSLLYAIESSEMVAFNGQQQVNDILEKTPMAGLSHRVASIPSS